MARATRRRKSGAGIRVEFRGKELGPREFRRIRELIASKLTPTRQQIARETCRMFGWRRANGATPVRACRELLLRLDQIGVICLPPARRSGGSTSRPLTPIEDEALLGPTPVWRGPIAANTPLEIRRIVDEERPMFRAYLRKYHYLGDSPLVGESLRYVAWLDGELVALLGWAGATLHNGPRDRHIGWDEMRHRDHLHLVVNNARFLILPWVKQPNLASRILGVNLRCLSRDWHSVYGHPVLLAETFVDPSRFRGTCYRASNWVHVGETKGWSRHGADYYRHDQPKAVFLYPLRRKALERLRSPTPWGAPAQRGGKKIIELDIHKLPLEGDDGLFSLLATFTDSRKRRGIRHSLQSVLAVATCAVLAGQRAFTAIEEWARDQSKEDLRLLGCRFGRPPSERTFRRVLKDAVDVDEVDRKLGLWVARQESALKGMGVAVDGKTLRGSRDGQDKGVHLLSAVVHGSSVVVAQMRVSDKTNEIPCLRPLLAELDIQGAVITADALHTQRETVRHLVEDRKADYVLTVKDNQPTLRKDIEDLFTEKEEQAQRKMAAQGLDREAFPP